MNINVEARKHLVSFLNKVLSQSYTRNEYENFVFSGYQEPMLENVRAEMAKLIAKHVEPNGFQMTALDENTRASLEFVIQELEKINN